MGSGARAYSQVGSLAGARAVSLGLTRCFSSHASIGRGWLFAEAKRNPNTKPVFVGRRQASIWCKPRAIYDCGAQRLDFKRPPTRRRGHFTSVQRVKHAIAHKRVLKSPSLVEFRGRRYVSFTDYVVLEMGRTKFFTNAARASKHERFVNAFASYRQDYQDRGVPCTKIRS